MTAARTITILATAFALAACASTVPEPVDPVPVPLVMGATAGLEVHRWVVDDRDHAVARALASLVWRPVPLDAPLVEQYRVNGFRLLACDPSEADALLAQLRPVAPVQHQWYGMLGAWTELIAGPDLPGGVRTTTDAGVVELAPGRLRLLARCWTVLDPARTVDGVPAAAIRVELIPQYELSRRIDPLRAALEPERTIADEGVTFHRLRASWVATQDQALIIVAESDNVDWNDLPPPFRPAPPPSDEPGPNPDGDEQAPDTGPLQAAGDVFGPEPLEPPTIGELMLIGRDLTESATRAKVVLVLIPRAPEVFELSPG